MLGFLFWGGGGEISWMFTLLQSKIVVISTSATNWVSHLNTFTFTFVSVNFRFECVANLVCGLCFAFQKPAAGKRWLEVVG